MIDIAYNAIIVVTILCAVISIYLFNKSNKIECIFHYYIWTKGFFEILAHILMNYVENNLIGLHFYTLVQFIILSFFFKKVFEVLRVDISLKIILPVGIGIIILNSLFLQPVDTFNSNTRFLVELYLIVLNLILFIFLIRDRRHDKNYLNPSVSFNSAIFLESTGSMIFYLYSNKIVQMEDYYSGILFDIRLFINFLIILIIMFGLFQIWKRNKIINEKTLL